jgi:hypothetical protein
MVNKNPQLAALLALVERVPGDGQLSNKVRNALAHVAKEAETLHELLSSPDPMQSKLAHDLRADAARARLRDVVAKSRESLASMVSTFAAEQAASRTAKAKLTPGQFDAEIRSVMRGLDTETRMKALDAAFKTGDTATLSAILTAPPALSGLSAGQHLHFTQSWLDHAAPFDGQFLPELNSCIQTSLGVADSMAKPPAAAPTATA